MAPVKTQKSNQSDAGNYYTCDKCSEERGTKSGPWETKMQEQGHNKLSDILKEMSQDQVIQNQKSSCSTSDSVNLITKIFSHLQCWISLHLQIISR